MIPVRGEALGIVGHPAAPAPRFYDVDRSQGSVFAQGGFATLRKGAQSPFRALRSSPVLRHQRLQGSIAHAAARVEASCVGSVFARLSRGLGS